MKTEERRYMAEVDDPVICELRRRVQEAKCHEPKPGDADYLTPEQIRWIKEEDDED